MQNTARLIVDQLLDADYEWVGFDLDGTLAKSIPGKFKSDRIGKAVPKMVARLRRLISHGKKVKIFTARADDEESIKHIRKWLKDNELPSDLEITNLKDKYLTKFYDDRAISVEKNTGEVKESIIEAIIGKDIKPAHARFGDDEDEEMENALRQPFTALDYALRYNRHHPKIWNVVKNSVYANEYRRHFKHLGLEGQLSEIALGTLFEALIEGQPSRVSPRAMQRALNHLERRNPAGYAQVISSPLGGVPAYAWDDPNSEWWSSEEAAALYAQTKEAAFDGPKPRLPGEYYPGTKVLKPWMTGTGEWVHENFPGGQPPAHVMAWFTNLLRTLKPVATWGIPATGQVYKIDQPNRTVTLIAGSPNDPDGWHANTKAVFQKLGYTMHDGQEPQEPDEQAFAESWYDSHGNNRFVLLHIPQESASNMEKVARELILRHWDRGEDLVEAARGLAAKHFPDYPNAFEDIISAAYSLFACGEGYGEMMSESLLTESPKIETLKKHQVDLTDEERNKAIDAGAVWHMNGDGKPTCAIKKATVKGKTWYWSNTHRCAQVSTTLKAAIRSFHDVVEPSA